MNLSNISNVNTTSYLQEAMNNKSANLNTYPETEKGNGFAELLEKSITALNNEQLTAEHHQRDIASGEVKDLQKAIIEIDRAGLSLTLAGEVKNKVLSAYKEIMNTQI